MNLSGRGDKDIATVADLDAEQAARGAGGGRHEPHRRHLRRACATAAGTALIPYVTAGDPHADSDGRA